MAHMLKKMVSPSCLRSIRINCLPKVVIYRSVVHPTPRTFPHALQSNRSGFPPSSPPAAFSSMSDWLNVRHLTERIKKLRTNESSLKIEDLIAALKDIFKSCSSMGNVAAIEEDYKWVLKKLDSMVSPLTPLIKIYIGNAFNELPKMVVDTIIKELVAMGCNKLVKCLLDKPSASTYMMEVENLDIDGLLRSLNAKTILIIPIKNDVNIRDFKKSKTDEEKGEEKEKKEETDEEKGEKEKKEETDEEKGEEEKKKEKEAAKETTADEDKAAKKTNVAETESDNNEEKVAED